MWEYYMYNVSNLPEKHNWKPAWTYFGILKPTYYVVLSMLFAN